MLRTRHKTPRFVVGYDGSAASRAALHYAARLAGDDGALMVVYAFQPPAEDLGWQLYEEAQARGRALLEAIEVDRALAFTNWRGEAVAGAPAEVIDAAARNFDADAIFVGSRGAGRARALVGSVSHDLVHRADRPVTVVPERALEAGGRASERLNVPAP